MPSSKKNMMVFTKNMILFLDFTLLAIVGKGI
jgi:hypothetical protein